MSLLMAGEAYTKAFYDDGAHLRMRFMGVPVQKTPNDLWAMQELFWETRPDLVIETGTFAGGSALYYATLFEAWGHGQVLTIDIGPYARQPHPRISYLTGSSIDPAIVDVVEALASAHERVMVILDSDHSARHVAAELAAYHHLVTPGQYLLVEDTLVNGHPADPAYGPGPMEALEDFLFLHPEFESHRSREKHGVTYHPRGFLYRRVKS